VPTSAASLEQPAPSPTLPGWALAAAVLLGSGCAERAPADADWHRHVAPIVMGSCASCHTAGGPAPFALDTYEAAAPIAGWIASVTASRQMPPWGLVDEGTCDQARPFHDDPSLTDLEIDTLRAWADSGAPLGDPAQAAPLPVPDSFALPDPTRRLLPRGAYTVAGDTDDFRCVVYDPELTEAAWITGLEVVPDASAVVHHALVYLDPTGASEALADADGGYPCFGSGGIPGAQLLGGWIPASGAVEFPPDSGMEAPAGSRLVVQFHYFGTGTPTPDASAVDLRWVTSEPPRKVTMTLEGNAASAAGGLQPGEDDVGGVQFRIPAGKANHREVIRWTVPAQIPEVALFLVAPHMHLAGVDMAVRVERVDAGEDRGDECLVQASRYDFNWQRLYRYDAPLAEVPRLQGGDVLVLECTYDNSLENPRIRDALTKAGLSAPVDIGLGEGSLDEMCLAVLGVAY
jgi:hypothetical protein